MNAVLLVEFFDATNSFDEEGDERGLGFFGDVGEERFKSGGEFWAHVVGHLHPGDEDFDVGVFGAGFADDSQEVLFGLFGRNAAEAVVAAEGDDKNVGSFGQGPVDPTKAAGGGIAAHSGVGDGVGEFCLGDLFLKERGVGFLGIESVSGRDTVAEDDDAFHRIGCIRGFFCE